MACVMLSDKALQHLPACCSANCIKLHLCSQVRLIAVSAAVLAAARFSPAYLSSKALGFVHLLAFGTFLGTNIWTTFVAGLTMFKNLPRQVRHCYTDSYALGCSILALHTTGPPNGNRCIAGLQQQHAQHCANAVMQFLCLLGEACDRSIY